MKKNNTIDYERPVEIADGVFWVGFFDKKAGLHCNPYLIIDGDEAVVIDGGSRPDFATVMMKILQTGLLPNQIKALIYQHYDPDLCGSIPNFEEMIKRDDLQLISARENFMFIRHYSIQSKLYTIERDDYKFTFSSGRTLEFIRTPYSHSVGSFVTFDPASKIIFTSDLFGSLAKEWELFFNLENHCMECVNVEKCPQNRENCPIRDIESFHASLIPSEKALKYALNQLQQVPFKIIAPQHGSIMVEEKIIQFVIERLSNLKGVGIDGIVGNGFHFLNQKKRFSIN